MPLDLLFISIWWVSQLKRWKLLPKVDWLAKKVYSGRWRVFWRAEQVKMTFAFAVKKKQWKWHYFWVPALVYGMSIRNNCIHILAHWFFLAHIGSGHHTRWLPLNNRQKFSSQPNNQCILKSGERFRTSWSSCFLLLPVALASRTYRSYAYHTSNTGIYRIQLKRK